MLNSTINIQQLKQTTNVSLSRMASCAAGLGLHLALACSCNPGGRWLLFGAILASRSTCCSDDSAAPFGRGGGALLGGGGRGGGTSGIARRPTATRIAFRFCCLIAAASEDSCGLGGGRQAAAHGARMPSCTGCLCKGRRSGGTTCGLGSHLGLVAFGRSGVRGLCCPGRLGSAALELVEALICFASRSGLPLPQLSRRLLRCLFSPRNY